jgi:charged multivesicular body protein 5
MRRVFGKKKAAGPPPPSLEAASGAVGKRAENIEAKITALDRELNVHKQKLKTTKNPSAKKGIQKRAIEVLKRKRMYEQQRDTLMGQQFNMDQAAFGIESAKATIESVSAMKAANVELKKVIKKDLNVDDIDDLADDMADMMDEMNEINEAMGRNFATPEDVTEADLEAELDMLEDELEDEELVGDASPSYLQDDALPVNPTGVPQNQTSATPAGL